MRTCSHPVLLFCRPRFDSQQYFYQRSCLASTMSNYCKGIRATLHLGKILDIYWPPRSCICPPPVYLEFEESPHQVLLKVCGLLVATVQDPQHRSDPTLHRNLNMLSTTVDGHNDEVFFATRLLANNFVYQPYHFVFSLDFRVLEVFGRSVR